MLRDENGKKVKYPFNYKQAISRQEHRARHRAEGRRHDRGAVVKMIRRLKYISVAAIGALTLGGTALRAQQQPVDPQQQRQQPMAPIPAIRSPLASGADNGDTDETPDSQEMTPDTRSLTGAEDLSLGTIPLGHSYWQPVLQCPGTVDSNPEFHPAVSSDWGTWTSFIGGVDIHHISGLSDIFLSYTGGGIFSSGGGMESGVIQEFGFTDRFQFRRSTFSVFEQLPIFLSPLSDSRERLVLECLAGGGVNLGTGFTPGQSILAAPGPEPCQLECGRVGHQTNSEGFADLRRKLRVAAVFPERFSKLSVTASFQAGYNYQVTRKDTIAVSYTFGAFRYSNLRSVD